MKLKNPDFPIYLYPHINSNLCCVGDAINIKFTEEIDVILSRNKCNLIRVPGIGFSWVWDDDLIKV